MAELPGEQFTPERALPRFGRSAWRGSIAPAWHGMADTRIGDPMPVTPPRPFPVVPVNVTAYSAGNRFRAFIQTIGYEWWNWRHRMTGDVFVADSAQFTRYPARRMAEPRRLTKVVPNQRVVYEAPSYGPQGNTSGLVRPRARRFYDQEA